jgi:hypothetical protein
MPQDKASGAEASEFGLDCAKRVAAALGAEKLSTKNNRCVHNGADITIHCAKTGNTKIGATYNTLDSVVAVWGAFQIGDEFEVVALPVDIFKTHMEPTKSTGASAGKVGIVPKSVFDRLGKVVGRVRL